ncbi:hypothetical protein PICMEDRAFT_14020 [Pichia membranifaciens NRRL Y-2026]|uniref:Transcription initiation factor IIA large subunit n=1 Tax=Pichia membranifaciens NRRL Y-2026 TaxID=763406 RepID=A0A1E3NQW5_9ASCO|nr:hypothetical protein PICMEDRAFT_14020 [Pichia membranifaciens NRRL Y-2026]ODQ48446.1 hypothetical protein PICMEDRAFT_14020 [Pichia membranifaciens NRRL Y-2026]
MSNPACAELYTSIIEDVIVESRQDFENAGIDEQTLQDLRQIWRQRLLASKVAVFPWGDPEEQGDGGADAEHQDGGGVGQTANEADADANGEGDADEGLFGDEDDEDEKKGVSVGVKNEDGAGLGFPDEQTEAAVGGDANTDLLSAPGLSQNDGLVGVVPAKQSRHAGGSFSGRFEKGAMPTVTFSVRNNQLDGSFDYGFDDDEDANGSSRKVVGGAVNGTGNSATNHDDEDEDDDEDDDDDLGSDLGADSDAINSDLDDSDDEDDEDADGDGDDPDGDGAGNDIEQNIMLCLYDRVQRVRNRWKCSLKDGLMNINGKDYVFQKATGDSEW